MRFFVVLLASLCVTAYGKSLSAPVDTTAIEQKISEIENSIVDSFQAKLGAAATKRDELKTELSKTIGGAIEALKNKIAAEKAEKAASAAVAEPKGFFTDVKTAFDASKKSKIDELSEALATLQQAALEKKQKAQKTIDQWLTDLKSSYGAAEEAVQPEAKGFFTGKKTAEGADGKSKIDEILSAFEDMKSKFAEKKKEKQQGVKEALDAAFAKLQELQAEKETETVEAETKGFFTGLKEKKAEKDAAKQDKMAAILDSFTQLKEQMTAKKEAKEAEKQKSFDSILAKLREIKAEKDAAAAAAVPQTKGAILDLSNKLAAKKEEERQTKIAAVEGIIGAAQQLIAQQQKKKAEKDQKKQELIDQVTPYLHQKLAELQTTFADFKAQKKEEWKTKWDSLKSSLTDLKTQLDAKKAEKDAAKQAKWDELKAKIHEITHPVAEVAADGTAAVEVAPKASFLNDITGVSSWQTVTWVLLVVCVLLALALVGAIFFQVSQRSKYERLSGQDDGEFPPAVRSTSYERAHGVPATTFAASSPSAPSAYPTKDIQQF